MEEIKTGVFKVDNNIPIYIIGDIHGDYQCLIHCLVDLCKVTNIKSIEDDNKFNELNREILEWNESNNSIVIFSGDLIHRKRFQDSVLDDECSDIFIIKTLLRLKNSAKKYGGDIIIISGNHEIMNILDPSDTMYTSDKNIKSNTKYFSSHSFVNNYINKTYAWIKLNDILIAHGGLCSDYLKFLDNENEFKKNIGLIGGNIKISSKNNIMIGGYIIEYGDNIIQYINNEYRNFFTNYSLDKIDTNSIGYKLFVDFDRINKCKHNMFWCREWGYSGINCNNLNKVLEKINCNKMIIAHCPQFLSNDKPKMINFECEYDNKNIIQKYKIARVDLGMSRCFEYNKSNEFIKFLSYNYNRKISILKLSCDESINEYYFNYDSVITEKISCIQYLLIKYGMTKKEWNNAKIITNWLGFEYIEQLLDKMINYNINLEKCSDLTNPLNILLCLLHPLYFNKPDLISVKQFSKYK